MSSSASSSPFPVVYPDRHFLPISLYTPPRNYSAVLSPPMDELSLNFTYISLNDHPALAGSEEYQRFICAYGSQPQIVETQSLPLYAPVPSQGHGPAFMTSPDFVCQASESSPFQVDEAENSPDDFSELFCDGDSFPTTFPTPSELLAELAEKGLAVTTDSEFATDARSTESASKSRRRAMAKSVGFVPTDPDSISSHEKKRHYLATLEQYVLFLSQQLEQAGIAQDFINPVHSCRGLSSQSIRILLVHMANVTRRLNQITIANEQKYLALSAEVARREALLQRQ